MSALRTRVDVEREEDERLAPWAVRSRGAARVVDEEPHPYRSDFQRDRDRVVHSRAFRRLQYKTQVFVAHEGDHYRNRLTHTLEAAQITRTIARSLRLNEDLAEAVVLAHDLGHTPFGHAGERVLHECLRDDGGFDHNRQSLRVVDLLEERYPGFRGINLTDATRAGMLKHGARFEHPVPLPALSARPSLEAQVADHADEIAYSNHDLDDGLRAGILSWEALEEVALWREAAAAVEARAGRKLAERVRRAQTVNALINRLVTDLVEGTAAALAASPPASPEAARAAAGPRVRYSPACDRGLAELKAFLFDRFYNHPRVVRMNRKAERVLGDLYRLFREEPAQLPEHVRRRFPADGEARATADYVAGMTDPFAMQEHRRLLDPHERL